METQHFFFIVLGDYCDLPHHWTPYYRSFSSKILFSKPPQNSFFFYTTSLTKSLICEKNALVNSNTIKFKIDIQRMLRADYYTKSIPTSKYESSSFEWQRKNEWPVSTLKYLIWKAFYTQCSAWIQMKIGVQLIQRYFSKDLLCKNFKKEISS